MFIDLENEADSYNFLLQHIKKILHRFTVQTVVDIFSRNRLFLLGLAKILARNRLNFQIIRIFTAFLLK